MLPDIQEKTERSLYHALRAVTVAEGYIPDEAAFPDLLNGNITTAKAAQVSYDAAVNNIRTTKGFAVEIFNNSNNQSKGTKMVPRIVIETTSFYQGEIGLDTTNRYLPNGANNFNKVISGESLVSDYNFNVRLVCTSSKESRVLHGIMVKALPRRGYIKWYDEASLKTYGNVHIRFISSSEINWTAEGISEKIYRYEIKDLHEQDDIILNNNISAIDEIEVNTKTGEGDNKTIIN